jgi:hypothetical protein
MVVGLVAGTVAVGTVAGAAEKSVSS